MSDPHEPGPLFATEPDPDAPSDPAPASTPSTHRRRKAKRSRLGGCLPILVALAVVAVLGYVGVTKGLDTLKDRFSGPDDYAGPGTTSVTFEVRDGESVTTVAQNLEQAGVVASVEAFTDAVDESGESVQVGIFPLKQEMQASDVVAILVDGDERLSSLTLTAGKTVKEIVQLLARDTDFSKQDFQQALDDPKALGLPDDAEGNAEGYLYPGQYYIGPDTTAASLLAEMVDRFKGVAKDVDLAGAARRLGYTQHELVTVASLLQAEVPAVYMPKVARIIYNRLENVGTAGTVGLLQIDATVAYALGKDPRTTALTQEQLDIDSPYNTRLYTGLPPGPIDQPSQAALEAATKPADGEWYYYVTTNLRTGKTKFATSNEEFLEYKNEYLAYCETSDAC